MQTLEEAFDHDRALVWGIGGSGDVVGTIPTARLLESHGVEVVLGGVAWEPAPEDPIVGPRPFEGVTGLDHVTETVGWATPETQTIDDVPFSESRVADALDERVILIDSSKGIEPMIDGLEAACEQLDLDLVVGTDSGGDALARGNEPGLQSPVSDAMGLVTLEALAVESILGVFGFGSDGELSIDELNGGIARAAERDGLLGAWGITPRIRTEMEAVLETVRTEASRLPVEAARGSLGPREIRSGNRSVELTPASTITYYFRPEAVAATSTLVDPIRDAVGIEKIVEAFADRGLTTEYDLEVGRLENANERE
jgi:hypothetical protein